MVGSKQGKLPPFSLDERNPIEMIELLLMSQTSTAIVFVRPFHALETRIVMRL
jgi:hypothetical protein